MDFTDANIGQIPEMSYFLFLLSLIYLCKRFHCCASEGGRCCLHIIKAFPAYRERLYYFDN
nr:MAG TPA: hypothetical protein [Caudoviricetes sp.]